jgi:hypothetical protein
LSISDFGLLLLRLFIRPLDVIIGFSFLTFQSFMFFLFSIHRIGEVSFFGGLCRCVFLTSLNGGSKPGNILGAIIDSFSEIINSLLAR